MLRNYIKIALRHFIRQWSFSILNISGLAVGMAASILIFIWIVDEWNYDRFHDNLPELYRVYEKQEYAGQDPLLVYNTPGPLAPALQENFPEFKNIARFSPIWQQLVFSRGEKLFHEREGYFADREVFEMFTFEFVSGNAGNALKDPGDMVITTGLAEKYFGNEDPLGQTIRVNNDYEFTVTAVVAKPSNTHFNYDFIITFETNIERFRGQTGSSWNSNSFYTYVQINAAGDYRETESKITDFIRDHQPQTSLHLEPLHQSNLYNIHGTGSIHSIRMFTIVALIVLLIACINFMNLSTARSLRRAKEVGLRKVAGGTRTQIASQLFGESVLFSVFALCISLVLVEILMPWFNQLTGKDLSVSILSLPIIAGLILIAVITGFVSGSYPALFLSSFKPVDVLKGSQRTGSKSFRRALVVFQFSLSVALIISTLVIRKQMDFVGNKHLGFQKESIVTLYTSANTRANRNVLMQELAVIPGVLNITASNDLPSRIGNSTYGISWEGSDPDERALFNFLHVDFDFIETFGMEMASGRSFSSEYASDSLAYLINEEAASFIGGNEILGKSFTMWGREGTIIGVVRNFHFQDLKQKINPIVIRISKPEATHIHLRLHPETILSTMEEVESTWAEICRDEPVNFQFFDQQFDRMYRSEQRTGKLFTWFSVLAVVISCLGLFGLASYMSEQKTREIGVRKVFGAGIFLIMGLMVKEFIRWVLVSVVIGMPAAWYLMDRWLDNFVFRTGQGVYPYAMAAMAAICIALITVTYQAVRAALSNPANSLRHE
jgi:putative ABC transport system permease protein